MEHVVATTHISRFTTMTNSERSVRVAGLDGKEESFGRREIAPGVIMEQLKDGQFKVYVDPALTQELARLRAEVEVYREAWEASEEQRLYFTTRLATARRELETG
jgi:hypothetical protein